MKAFAHYHPVVLLAYFSSVLLVTMFASNPVLEGSALLGGALFCLMLQRRGELAGNIGFYVPLFLMIAVTNPLFSHNGVTPLFFLNGNPVTLEAFIYGLFIAVMLVGVMLWCKCCGECITDDKFLYLFGRAFPRLSLVLSMALRFVPRFRRQMHTVNRAQRAMGLYASKSFMDKIHSAMRVFMAMIAWSFENAMETADSMRARGYGMKGRTSFSLFRFYPKDGALLAASLLLAAATLAGMAAGVTEFYYYPQISELHISPATLAVYGSFLLLSLFPFLLEVKEAFVWKYCISRI